MSTATTKTAAPPKSLRSGVRVEDANDREDVEKASIHAKDIVKIFTADNEYTEVTHEQVQRVKQSKSSCSRRYLQLRWIAE